MRALRILTLTLFALIITTSAFAQHGGKTGMKFNINDPMNRNTVTFKSTAPLEDIVGTSNQITGWIMFDPNNPEKGGHGELTVPVASLDSGIPLRDEHIRGADWLNAEMYPNITLKIDKTKNVTEVKSTQDAKTYDIILVGSFSLHGKTRSVEIPGRFTYLMESDKTQARLPGDLLAARASFEIELADYGVTGPKGMDLIGSKVGETISLDVSFVANSQTMIADGAMNPCGDKAMNPCGDKAMNPCAGK